MVTTVAAAVKNAPWQGANGIITEGADTDSNDDGDGFKGMSASTSIFLIHSHTL